MNYYKQQQRRFDVARNYERSLGRAEGAPLMVRTVAAPVEARVISETSIVYTKKFGYISVTGDGSRTVKRVNGKRRITYK